MLSGRHTIWTNPRFQSVSAIAFFLLTLLYIFHNSSSSARRAALRAQVPDLPWIPETIWHIFLHKRDIPSHLRTAIHSWSYLNPTHRYNLVETISATQILFDLYHDHPEIAYIFNRLESTVMRADFLRYVLLAAYGGVYTDVDTLAIQPIKEWIPEQYRNFTRVVVGIEYDQRNETRHVSMPHSLSLCQWTMAATANHPLMWSVVQEAMWSIETAADKAGTDVEHLRPSDRDVITITGPGLWTSSIIRYLRARGHANLSYGNFSGLTEPLLIDDILVLPIDAFGSGQPHSGSTEYKDADGQEVATEEKRVKGALARHLFSMSWRHNCAGVQGDGSPCW